MERNNSSSSALEELRRNLRDFGYDNEIIEVLISEGVESLEQALDLLQ